MPQGTASTASTSKDISSLKLVTLLSCQQPHLQRLQAFASVFVLLYQEVSNKAHIYTHTHTYIKELAEREMQLQLQRLQVLSLLCFTSTKVQVLTHPTAVGESGGAGGGGKEELQAISKVEKSFQVPRFAADAKNCVFLTINDLVEDLSEPERCVCVCV